jgi:serine/threonine protein kinase
MSVSGGRTRVGRYELGRTLGEGTFAKVKFARNADSGENVAIKILDKDKVLKHKMIAQVSSPILFSIPPIDSRFGEVSMDFFP